MNQRLQQLLIAFGLAVIVAIEVAVAAEPETAWRPGQPQACLKNGEELLTWFKGHAKNLGGEEKLRILIIGDSLSDGGYHWSHYPYLNIEEGLDSSAMKQLGWFKDNIHLAQPGGQGIGEAIARLFLP